MPLDLCNISGNVLKILVSVLLKIRTTESWRREDALVACDDRFLALKKANDI